MRVTIAVPEQHIADANALANVIGYGSHDADTYGPAAWQDSTGNLYSVASVIVADSFPTAATSPLVLPAWGGDLVAATRAQALIQIGLPASPSAISAIFGDDPHAALQALGVTRIAE